MIYDVFISYSSEEQQIANRLVAYLEYYNLNCFVAYRDIPDGIAWTQGIAEAIKHSKMLLVLFSDSFNSSIWLDEELKIASNLGIPILTLSFSSVAYSDEKGKFLKNTPNIDMICDAEMKFTTVYEELCQLIGIPVEPVLPASDVLSSVDSFSCDDKQHFESETTVSGKAAINTPLNKNSSHHLVKAFIIGLLFAIILVLLLEWMFNL